MNTVVQLNRPQPNEQGVFQYAEVMNYLEKKYGFDQYNVNQAKDNFEQWCKRKGYLKLKKDPEGKHYRSSQIWFNEYCEDPDGLAACPKEQNFWHWLIGVFGLDTVKGDKPFALNVQLLLERYDTDLAPLLQKLFDAQQERINAAIESTVPPEYRRRALLQNQLSPAAMPEFARKILEYIHTEFGPQLLLKV